MQDNNKHLLNRLRLYIPDLWSAKAHNANFQNTRSGYLREQISMLTTVWGILIILWVPLDLIFLSSTEGLKIAIARIALAAYLFTITNYSNRQTTLQNALKCLTVMVIGLNLFYIYSMQVLNFPSGYNGIEYGYTLLPILHVAILTIFPLTVKESLCLLCITAVSHFFINIQAGRPLSPESLADYWLQSVLAMMMIWSQLSKLYMLMRLYRQATLDPLTGIYNRRMLLQLANNSVNHCESKGLPFSVLIFDIDRFKRINDTWGHGAGDTVLRGFADFMQTKIRKTDLFGRYGGEEFILFLPCCNTAAAEKIANRMLGHIRQLELPIGYGDTTLQITTCIGISTYSSSDTLSSMIERADRALYECKDSGRDCYRFHPVGFQYQRDERRQAIA